ncbi:tumor necrosis factor receptor superfamily member 17-like [Pristis pectinata]|uniref:tumor necrosis factor receptor superfamily member 17-like n=1 Tax=Pristis pectinata TaxID=685728 RepID=UPI00223D2AB6|nr:tumor necrosis factor receptor superfamily member 17-like [Pristis pectinata]
MARECSKSFYFDELTTACKPCELRCINASTRPAACQGYNCSNTPVSSMTTKSIAAGRLAWIIVGLLPLLILIFIVFILFIRKLHQRKANAPFKSTDVMPDSNVIISNSKETAHAEDAQEFSSVRNQQSDHFVESDISICTVQGSEVKILISGVQGDNDYDASFPLPATEEGATALVTTKTAEWRDCRKMHNFSSDNWFLKRGLADM